MKKLVKNWHMRDQLQLSAAILARWRRLVASNKALKLLHWGMCAVTYRRIAMAIKTASFLGVFVDCCLFACRPGGRWGDTKQVVARCRCPVFWSSPGHAASGDAVCIAPAHRCGHRNGRRTRCICLSSSILFINNNHSQRPCYGPLKLKLRHSDIYYNVISLLLCFGHPPMTMDAVLSTIVASG
jgi:hypothetical protein